MKSNNIEHQGIIDSFTERGARVRIMQNASCHDCKIASACNSAESKTKFIDVTGYYRTKYKIGDEVTVVAGESVGLKAVLYAFGFPMALMLLFIFVTYLLGGSDGYMALAGLFSLLPSYITLYLLRGHFEKSIIFYLKQTN